MENVHKYFCTRCQRWLIAESPTLLASEVNTHNDRLHPLDFSKWTAAMITDSGWYQGPELKITEADRQFLAKGHVLWD